MKRKKILSILSLAYLASSCSTVHSSSVTVETIQSEALDSVEVKHEDFLRRQHEFVLGEVEFISALNAEIAHLSRQSGEALFVVIQSNAAQNGLVASAINTQQGVSMARELGGVDIAEPVSITSDEQAVIQRKCSLFLTESVTDFSVAYAQDANLSTLAVISDDELQTVSTIYAAGLIEAATELRRLAGESVLYPSESATEEYRSASRCITAVREISDPRL